MKDTDNLTDVELDMLAHLAEQKLFDALRDVSTLDAPPELVRLMNDMAVIRIKLNAMWKNLTGKERPSTAEFLIQRAKVNHNNPPKPERRLVRMPDGTQRWVEV